MQKSLRTYVRWSVIFISIACGAAAAQTCTPNAAGGPIVPAGQNVIAVPHLVAGNGFVVKLAISNLANTANQITVNNVNADGTLLSSSSCTIPANGVLRI